MPNVARPFGLIFVFALLLLSANFASAEQLWNKVQYGMSPTEVLRAVPGSKPLARNSRSTSEAQAAVEIESYPFAGGTFNVTFIFSLDRLTQIHLHDTLSMRENEATRNAFERVSAALRQTYGEESSRKLEARSSGLYGEAEWLKGESKIDVTVVPVTQLHSAILINFFKLK